MSGVQRHPLVLHYMEEHEGVRQDSLMKVTEHYKKALETQVLESVRIEEVCQNLEENLNLKSEWAQSKLPGIKVRVTKVSKKIEERSNLLRGCLIRGPTAPQITFFSVRRAFV